jgi:hypothetical protein
MVIESKKYLIKIANKINKNIQFFFIYFVIYKLPQI